MTRKSGVAPEAPAETTLAILGMPDGAKAPLPVSGGIPFPPGLLKGPRRLAVFDSHGARLPSQAETLVRWEDGSVKAALVTVAGAEPGRTLRLRWGRGASRAKGEQTQRIKIRKTKTRRGRRITVETGAARFVFAAEPTPVLQQIHAGGTPRLSEPLGLCVQTLSFVWYDAGGPGAMRVEADGPLRAVVRLSGSYRSRDRAQRGLKWILRVEMWAGEPSARLVHTLVDDDPRSMVRLRNVGLSLRTRGPIREYAFGGEKGTDGVHRGRFRPGEEDAEGYLYQAGRPGSCEGVGAETSYSGVGSGRHAAGWVQAGSVAIGVKHFWQQFPKELAVSPRGIDVWLHTDRGGEYFWSEVPGIAKTHEMLLLAGTSDPRAAFEAFGGDPLLAATPAWYLSSGVFPFLAPMNAASKQFDAVADGRFEGLRWPAIGWKHFGDRPLGQSAGPQPARSFGNHHYEEPRTLLHQFLRTGEHRWFREGVVGARHFMDIDVQHSPGPNRHAEGGGVRPNPGPGFVWMHYSHDHQGLGHVSHFHLGGLAQYYLLSGDARAREVLKEVADHTASLIEDPPPTFADEILSEGTLARCGPRLKTGYWGQSRAPGWLIHLMHQAYQATGDVRYPRAAAKVVNILIRQWRTPTPYLKRGERIGMLKPPNGCWAFHWQEDEKVCTGLEGWGSAIVLMSVVEFLRDNDRLGLLPRKTLLEMMHQNARHMVRHIWDSSARAFRYTEFGRPRPDRYWPNSIYLFPLMAAAKLTNDGELERVCRETYDGPLGIARLDAGGALNLAIGMWLTPHYLALVDDREDEQH